MKFFKFSLAVLLLLMTGAGSLWAINTGQDAYTLFGGKSGDVPFPHRLHQTKAGDCNVCHDTFPQEKGALGALKKEGRLKKKQVMNTICLKCHRAMKKAGTKTGPTGCKGCHIK